VAGSAGNRRSTARVRSDRETEGSVVTPELVPATGAWRPGDDVGHRRFFTFATDRGFALDCGVTLRDVTLAYETWGELADDASNAVLLCHAWTGDSHAAGSAGRGHPTVGWWDGFVGPGKPIDTDRWFVVCSNVLGGCQGSTGPASPAPFDGKPFGSRFPVITIRDMVRAQARLADHLGIGAWHTVIGGSMGGMQVLEWGVMYPERVRGLVPIAACMQATAQQIAWGSIGRRVITLDPRWRGGDYYDAAPGDGPGDGLAIARMVAQVTFRSDNVFTERFGRAIAHRADLGDHLGLWQQFEVERYLDHHGTKLGHRFDANSYIVIGKAMDLHDLARSRGHLEAAMSRINAPLLSLGISSDMLYPNYQQRQLVELLLSVGSPAGYAEIDSPHGHDAFLINLDRLADPVADFLDCRKLP
jgi:homoserine O-acetyltransferase